MTGSTADHASSVAPRALFVTRELLDESMYGSGAYVLDILRFLQRKGWEIEFCLLPVSRPGNFRQDLPEAYQSIGRVSIHHGFVVGRALFFWPGLPSLMLSWPRALYMRLPQIFKQAFRRLRSDLRSARAGDTRATTHAPLPTGYALTNETDFLTTRCLEFKPEVVIANYAWLANSLAGVPREIGAIRLVLTCDILHQRQEQYDRLGLVPDINGWTRAAESSVLANADVLIGIQDEDSRILREMAPGAAVVTLPISVAPITATGAPVAGRCLFVGSQAEHNIISLRWFLQEIWPIVLKQFPASTLHVVGGVCNEFSPIYPNTLLLGNLPSIDGEYANAEVCVIPVVVGSGLKIKLLEAMAHGRASVVTSTGAYGVQAVCAPAVLMADTPAAFADAIATLFRDPDLRSKMESRAHQVVLASFAADVVYAPLLKLIDERRSIQTRGVERSA